MSYSIGQYFHIPNTQADDFMKALSISVQNIDIIGANNIKFTNAGFGITSGPFQSTENYYVHCDIAPLQTEQVFHVKLMNRNDTSKQQYVKTIIIPSGVTDAASMVSIEFTFKPIAEFDTLVFELQRETDDYINPRVTHILMEEISLVKNILPTLVGASNLVKIGVQGVSGVRMCINNEDIIIGRTGIYEIKNGIIEVDYFSVVAAGQLNGNVNDEKNNAINNNYGTKTNYVIVSRTIPGFTLDYIYEKEDN